MISIGIDPGLSGAIVAYGPNGVIDGMDMPTKPSALKGATVKRRVDGKAIMDMLRQLAPAGEAAVVTIELVEGRGDNGRSSLMSTAETYGVLRAAIEIAQIRYVEVRSYDWKKPMGLMGKGAPKGLEAKEAARQMAIKLMPELAGKIARKKDHNRAEAALIARYGYFLQA